MVAALGPVLVALTCAPAALAATLAAGAGKTYATPCAAIAAAKAGDVIEVDAASYDGDTCAWSTDNLTVRGVGGRAKIDLKGGAPAQKKGIFTIAAPNATIENFEFAGAAISAADGNNGAGIRHQGVNLTVRGCYFHDNQNGILGAPSVADQGDVLIESSEFGNNGAGDGFSHNMYLNHYASFTLRGSYTHGAKVGHLIKTRAQVSTIAYNRITDESGTTASYEVDAPNGGTVIIVGNLIEQSNESQNPTVVAYAEEGATNADQHVYFVNNTVVSDRAAGGTFLNVAGAPVALVANNIFKGKGTICSLMTATLTHNWTDAQGDPMLASPATFDYHLAQGSPCVDQALAPVAGPGKSLLAIVDEYVHSAKLEPRSVVGAAPDIGAYEYGNVASPPDAGPLPQDGGPDASAGGDGGSAPAGGDAGAPAGPSGEPAGCACSQTGAAAGGGSGATAWLLAMALCLLSRRTRPART